ncbi:MAG: gliding motility protein GldN [Bacteroidales bacterium]|nr:MAG: gliding motility protein GldN [Bacteroidales bacterium]
MKRVVALFIGLSLITVSFVNLTAQDIKTEVYVREHIPNKQPVPYIYVREADVMWAKDVYRIIDLKQKQNLALYYPTHPIGDRMNLVDLLLYGIDNEGIRAFSTDDPLNEFTIPMTRDQIDEVFEAGIDTIPMADINTGEIKDMIVTQERKTDEVKQVMIKEKWFFDKNHSVMKVRIVGVSPIRVYNQLDDQGLPTDLILRKQTFWVYYPEVRPLLTNHEIFNQHNDAQRISFDDFLMQRRFSSFIIGVSNVYNNRRIISYKIGLDALLEADKQKQWLFEVEHDLWEY